MSGDGEWTQGEDGAPEYELVMPFLVCQSQGGPYEDESFVAGYALGRLDEQFEQRTVQFGMWHMMRTDSMSQVDLIAMKHQAVTEWQAHDEAPEWAVVCFHADPAQEAPR